MNDWHEIGWDVFTVFLQKNSALIIGKWMGSISRKLDPGIMDVVDEKYLMEEMKEIFSAVLLVWQLKSENWESSTEYGVLADVLSRVSAHQAKREVPPAQTALYIFCLREAIHTSLQESAEADNRFVQEFYYYFNKLMDRMGMTAFEAYARVREQVISEQNNAILELSTPIIKLWENILLLPLVGTVDTPRAAQIIEGLLKAIHEYEAQVAILDVTGVPVIDTRVAQHLIQTAAAARMLGAEVIITGISPHTAQTLVKLDIDLSMVRTKGRLQSGVNEAFRLLEMEIVSV